MRASSSNHIAIGVGLGIVQRERGSDDQLGADAQASLRATSREMRVERTVETRS